MPTVKNQPFDLVHDTQIIYRKLVDAMARPGKIVNIFEACNKTTPPDSFSKTMAGLAFLLLDTEVRFFVQAEEQARIEEYLRMNTFSSLGKMEDADFLFIDRRLFEDEIEELMSHVKKGTLQNPHNSATIFIAVDELGSRECGEEEMRLLLQGPGIREKRELLVSGLSEKWLVEREWVNEEYPTGVDLVFVCSNGDIAGLPRTTKIERRWM